MPRLIWVTIFAHNIDIILILLCYNSIIVTIISQKDTEHGVQPKMISVDNLFRIFEIIIFCFVVAICDLVHTVEATYDLPQVFTAFENLF